MSAKIILDTNTYLQLLLIVPAVALVGLTGSSIAEGTVGHNYTGGFAQVAPRADGLNNSSKTDELGPVRNSSVRERQS